MFEPTKLDSSYKDYTVLITGGTQGIGYAIAQAYRACGAETIITGTKKKQEYSSDLSEHQYVQVDFNQTESIQDAFSAIKKLDVLINNAGGIVAGDSSLLDTPEVFEKNFMPNLFGAYRVSHLFHPILSKSHKPGGASIVNIASFVAFRSMPLTLGYAAAKAGIVNITKGLSLALAKDRIRCNAIAPGSIIVDRMKSSYDDEYFQQFMLGKIPLHRFGTPEDLCGPCLFLTSPWASYITGQVLTVDGGLAEGLFSDYECLTVKSGGTSSSSTDI